jgi:thiazole synthase
VFLLDDHEIFRRGIRDLLAAEPDIEVVGEAGTAASALARMPALHPDVAVLDVRLPDGDGVSVCREICSKLPGTACLMLTGYGDDQALLGAIMAGAAGYVSKQTAGTDLVSALRTVASGESILDPHASQRVMTRLRQNALTANPVSALSEQEKRVLELIGEGLTNRQIADRMFLAEKTVKNYVSSMLTKLGMQRRTQAAAFAARQSDDREDLAVNYSRTTLSCFALIPHCRYHESSQSCRYPRRRGDMSVITDLDQPWLVLGGQVFRSRLIVGIEQYDSVSQVRRVLEASGADVFITTIDLDQQRSSLLLADLADELPLDEFRWIGTTSFARSADGALATARMLRDCYGLSTIKLDVRSQDNLPDNAATIKVAETLRAEGMDLWPFILPDTADAWALEQLGCAALRILAAPVGSGLGIPRPRELREVIESTELPVIIEGGLGTPRHVMTAMELGAAAVLVNTALARAPRPELLAASMRHAAQAGRLARLA